MALDANKHHYYEKVFQADGKSKAELYKATKAWIVKNIKVQAIAHYFDDTGMSAISTNPVIVVNGSTVDFKLNIDFKDGRYKLSANAFVLHNSYGVS